MQEELLLIYNMVFFLNLKYFDCGMLPNTASKNFHFAHRPEDAVLLFTAQQNIQQNTNPVEFG